MKIVRLFIAMVALTVTFTACETPRSVKAGHFTETIPLSLGASASIKEKEGRDIVVFDFWNMGGEEVQIRITNPTPDGKEVTMVTIPRMKSVEVSSASPSSLELSIVSKEKNKPDSPMSFALLKTGEGYVSFVPITPDD